MLIPQFVYIQGVVYLKQLVESFLLTLLAGH